MRKWSLPPVPPENRPETRLARSQEWARKRHAWARRVDLVAYLTWEAHARDRVIASRERVS